MGIIVVEAKLPAPNIPKFTLLVVGSKSISDVNSIFGSDLISYLKTTDRGLVSAVNFL